MTCNRRPSKRKLGNGDYKIRQKCKVLPRILDFTYSLSKDSLAKHPFPAERSRMCVHFENTTWRLTVHDLSFEDIGLKLNICYAAFR